MTDRATTYEELKETISRAYPRAVAAAAAPRPLRARQAARPRARHGRRGRGGERGAAVVDDPLRQRARLRRLLADAAGVPQPPGRALRAVPRAHRADAARRRAARGNGGVLHQFVGEAIAELQPARGARRRRGAGRGGEAARRARRRSTCWRSGAPSRSPATSPTRSTSSSCARTCSTASAACSANSRARIGAGDVLLVASFRNYSPAVVETALACRARGVSVIAITDSALSPLKPAADVCFELGDDSARPFRSLVAPLCLAQALVVSTGHQLAAAAPGGAHAGGEEATAAGTRAMSSAPAAARRRLHGPRGGRPVRRADRRPARGHALVRALPRRLAGQHRGRRAPGSA